MCSVENHDGTGYIENVSVEMVGEAFGRIYFNILLPVTRYFPTDRINIDIGC